MKSKTSVLSALLLMIYTIFIFAAPIEAAADARVSGVVFYPRTYPAGYGYSVGYDYPAGHGYPLKNIMDGVFSEIADQSYTGSVITPDFTIKHSGVELIKNKDYVVFFSDNRNTGTASVAVVGIGSFSGTKTAYFNIIPKDISNGMFTKIGDQLYTGGELKPNFTFTLDGTVLVRDKDFTAEYSENISVGTAAVTISGISNYSGTAATDFVIFSEDILLEDGVFFGVQDMIYTGAAIIPEFFFVVGDVVLVENTDYTAEYTDNINAGTAAVTLTGTGRYSGRVSSNFKIEPKNIAAGSFSAIPDQRHTGAAIRPDFIFTLDGVSLINGIDYTAFYNSNLNAGTAMIVISGKGNYTGTSVTDFTIMPPEQDNISDKKADLNYSFTFNSGSQILRTFKTEPGKAVPSYKLFKPVKKGYTFTGWYLDSRLKTPFRTGTVITRNTVVYAGFVKNYNAPKGFKITRNAKGAVRIRWQGRKNFIYQIFRRNKKLSSYIGYKRLKTTTGKMYTVRNSKKGTRFKVRGYKLVNGVRVYSRFTKAIIS
ncbi:MAG: InlB B-repeat-containing protein [Oscillospiraceae bacterium]|nr:InlB B-repeat-containing protein [Oscillospiraceae bacterium]